MNRKKFFSLFLACMMVLSLAACGGPDPTQPTTQPTTAPTTQPTTAPTTVPTTAPTEPEPEPEEVYTDALEQLQGITDWTAKVTSSRKLTIDGESFMETSDQTISFIGYGTEDMKLLVQEATDIDGYITEYRELYQNETLYVTIDNQLRYKSTMTQEELLERYIPLVMLDAALYEEITLQDNVLTFSLPTAGEAWIVPEYAELVTASGTATVNDSNVLSESTYTVTYSIGGISVTLDYAMSLDTESTPSSAQPGAQEYTELEFIDAPRILENTCGYLWQAYNNHSMSTTFVESIISHAGGIIRNHVTTINSWGSGRDYIADVDQSIFAMDVSGEYNYEQVEHFENGIYTYSEDGSTPTKNPGVSASDFQTYCANSLVANIPRLELITGATAEDLGSLYYLELSISEETADALCKSICQMFYNDENLLNDLASDYRTEELGYYLAIDKFTGLPTAVGMIYEGIHTIDGLEYPLSLQTDQSFNLCDVNVYKNLTDKVLTPEEPEEKATPLFYHVTGPEGQEMWLLGTIHVGDARTAYLPQQIYDAFDAADALAVEFNSEAFDEELENNEELSSQVSDCYFYNDGTTTEEHIEDAELFEYAEKLMKATGNYNMNSPYLKANLWGNSIENYIMAQFHTVSSQQGVDNQLIWRAEAQEKPIYDVESGLFQTQMLSGFSDALQEQLLLESVAMDPMEYIAGVEELFEMWCAGDEAALSAYLNDEGDLSELTDEELALIEEYNNAMGTDRNDDMLDVAIDYLESGEVVFYAVGLAHLLAEDGLVHTLRDAGYTVELVSFE